MKNLSRREFLKNGSMGIIGATMIPSFLMSNIDKAMGGTASGLTKLNDYYNHFNVDEKIIHEVIAEAMSQGADYCDLYFEHTISKTLGLQDKAVNRAFSNVDFGVGIRVLKGDQTGFSFTEEITPKAMKLAAKTAANIASSGGKYNHVPLVTKKHPEYYQIKKSWEEVSIDTKIPYLEKINDKMFDLDNRVKNCLVYLLDNTSYVLFANSDGIVTYDYKPDFLMVTNCVAEQDGKREQSYYTSGARMGAEFLTDENMDAIAKKCVDNTVNLFDAVKPEGGEMEIVLAAGESGILLHEAIGHPFEADFNRKGISIFADKMNKKIAENFVNIVDDGTNPNIRGSINIDDEGNESQKTYLVKDGVLKSYIHDKLSAQHYNVKPTGNGRRQSFRFAPLPRMRNTYMTPGPHTKEEIIKSVKHGIYAMDFTNGEVKIGAGDFTFYVKIGYMIENGKITKPVKDINIIGNGPDILSKVTMVADDFKMSKSGWSCGKGGQSIPVSLGLPTIKVSSITVGGV